MELLTDPQAWIALATLTALELVLGIDNVIFISILVDKLPRERRELARRSAWAWRCSCASACCWCCRGSSAWWRRCSRCAGTNISGRDLILIVGGLFLIWKSTSEIHQSLEGEEGHASSAVKATFAAVIVQIMIIDIVFSLDSIITAVGMVDEIAVMIAAVVVSVALMMLFAGAIGRFVSEHPTIKMLALSFLVVVGVVLIAEGFGHHVPKGYIYFAHGVLAGAWRCSTSACASARAKPAHLHAAYASAAGARPAPLSAAAGINPRQRPAAPEPALGLLVQRLGRGARQRHPGRERQLQRAPRRRAQHLERRLARHHHAECRRDLVGLADALAQHVPALAVHRRYAAPFRAGRRSDSRSARRTLISCATGST